MARVTVGIPTGDDADTQRLLGRINRTITDASAHGKVLHSYDFGSKCHGGLQVPVRCIVLGEVGHTAVQHDSRAHPVGLDPQVVRVAQHGGAVAQRPFAGQVLRGGLKRGQLVRDAAGRVGVAEVRQERHLVHLRQHVEPRPGCAVTLGGETQPIHAGIHLEEHPLRHVCLVRCEHVDLFVAVHGVPQVQARTQLQVACIKHPLQQQHRATPA